MTTVWASGGDVVGWSERDGLITTPVRWHALGVAGAFATRAQAEAAYRAIGRAA